MRARCSPGSWLRNSPRRLRPLRRPPRLPTESCPPPLPYLVLCPCRPEFPGANSCVALLPLYPDTRPSNAPGRQGHSVGNGHRRWNVARYQNCRWAAGVCPVRRGGGEAVALQALCARWKAGEESRSRLVWTSSFRRKSLSIEFFCPTSPDLLHAHRKRLGVRFRADRESSEAALQQRHQTRAPSSRPRTAAETAR